MAEMTSPNDVRYLSTATNSAKKAVPNVSAGWVVMLLSGLVAMAVFLFATSQGGEEYSVAVLDRRVEVGQAIPPDAFREAKVDMSKEQLNGLIPFNQRSEYVGWIATSQIEPGNVVNKSVVRKPGGENGYRSMSIAVDRTHAVGGDLHAGDRVDVIDASVTPSAYVGTNLEVLAVNNPTGNAIGATSGFSITVAVDATTAAQISRTMTSNKFDIIKSTGATPLPNPSTPITTP